jgi:two-component system, NarL family, nitrate/nitrite response regulator NarL
MKPIRIFLADDHLLILEGVSSLIQAIDDFELVGKTTTGEALIDALAKTLPLPDVCITDVEMPGMGGIAALKTIKERFPGMKVLMLTMHDEPFYINRAVKEGADGYILKNLTAESFAESVRKVVNGASFFTTGVRPTVSVKPATDESDEGSPQGLTPREKQILKRIAEGKSNKEIAKELFISNRTVDTHRNNLMRKLNISSSVQLVHYAYANNLV